MSAKIKCIRCGCSVPDVPEDATVDKIFCNGCSTAIEMLDERGVMPENIEALKPVYQDLVPKITKLTKFMEKSRKIGIITESEVKTNERS